jgi:hypothetical protein
MTKLGLDMKCIYASRAINTEIPFNADGTEREDIVIISKILTEMEDGS